MKTLSKSSRIFLHKNLKNSSFIHKNKDFFMMYRKSLIHKFQRCFHICPSLKNSVCFQKKQFLFHEIYTLCQDSHLEIKDLFALNLIIVFFYIHNLIYSNFHRKLHLPKSMNKPCSIFHIYLDKSMDL